MAGMGLFRLVRCIQHRHRVNMHHSQMTNTIDKYNQSIDAFLRFSAQALPLFGLLSTGVNSNM